MAGAWPEKVWIMQVTFPQDRQLGVEIKGLIPTAMTGDEVGEIRQLLYEHKLIVFVDIPEMTNTEYITFASRFGKPQKYFQKNYHHPDHDEIFVSSNVLEDGKKVGVAGTGMYWHSDYQFFDEPLPLTMVYPKRVEGPDRATHYIDMQRVLDALPVTLRQRLEGRRAIHEGKWRYKITPSDIDRSITDILNDVGQIVPAVTHPVCIRHPLKERDLLYVSSGFTVGIEGYSHEESRQLLQDLLAFIELPEHIDSVPWKMGRLLFWDNRQVLHRASDNPQRHPSVSYRIGIYDQLPFYLNRQ